MMNRKLINAVRELVEAVVILNCFVDEADEAPLNEQRTIARSFDVLREILAEPELSSLHKWAEDLLKHADDFDADEQWWFDFQQWKNDLLRRNS
jgi:hypothetical protein